MPHLTTREAAHRVGRSVRTIRKWRRQGMPVTFNGNRMHIDLEVLLAWYRTKLLADNRHPSNRNRHDNSMSS